MARGGDLASSGDLRHNPWVKGHLSPIDSLVQRRRALGLTQHAVAERAGLTQAYLSKIERRKLDPRLSTVQEIARAESLEMIFVPVELVITIRAQLGEGSNTEDRRLFTAEPD
jgi:transcriptional regulator with XRE-family HTH domain